MRLLTSAGIPFSKERAPEKVFYCSPRRQKVTVDCNTDACDDAHAGGGRTTKPRLTRLNWVFWFRDAGSLSKTTDRCCGADLLLSRFTSEDQIKARQQRDSWPIRSLERPSMNQ